MPNNHINIGWVGRLHGCSTSIRLGIGPWCKMDTFFSRHLPFSFSFSSFFLSFPFPFLLSVCFCVSIGVLMCVYSRVDVDLFVCYVCLFVQTWHATGEVGVCGVEPSSPPALVVGAPPPLIPSCRLWLPIPRQHWTFPPAFHQRKSTISFTVAPPQTQTQT